MTNNKLSVYHLVIIIALAAGWLNISHANTVLSNKNYRFSGFATLGLTKSGTENLGYRRNVSQQGIYDGDWSFAIDSLLGFQLDYYFSENLSSAIQVVARDKPSNELKESIEWAYLRYQAPSMMFRIGKIGVDLFALSEYRNLGFSYLWVRPPVEFYGAIGIDHFDGGDASYATRLAGGNFNFKAFAGRYSTPLSDADRDLTFKTDYTIGFTTTWEKSPWRLRMSFSEIKLHDSMDQELGSEIIRETLNYAASLGWSRAAGIGSEIDAGGKHFRYIGLGFGFDMGKWVIETEANLTQSEFSMYPTFGGYYLSLGYRINEAVTLYGLTAHSESREEPEEIPAPPTTPDPMLNALFQNIYQQVQIGLKRSQIDQTSNSLGVRWDLRHDVILKAQWDHTDVKALHVLLWNYKTPQLDDETIDTYSINLNFIF